MTYCDPEIASVGLTEPQAKEKYGEIETYEYNLGGNGKSQILQTAGLVKLVREKDGPIVGVHMIGARFGEQVGEASLIVNWEAFPEDVAQFIHAHPTQNESLGEAVTRTGRQTTSCACVKRRPTPTPDPKDTMATSVPLPALGESVTEGTVTRWLKNVGDTVAVDEPLRRDLHRQGRHRDPIAGGRRAAGDQGR